MAEPAAAQEEEGSEEEAQEAEYEFLGKFRTVIVGVRYYTGRVGVDEMVRFVREPANPHDANAIKVENMRAEQVGHIKRELAAEIAQLLDDGSLRIEGIMPGGQTNAYTLPVEVYAFGSGPQVAEALRRGIARAGIVLQSMSLAAAMATMQGSGSQSPGSSQGSQRGGYSSLAPQQMESSLQRLFEDLYAAAGPKPQMQPAPEVTSPLFQHQQEALAWMVQRENSNALPPFWTTETAGGRGGLVYVNTLTNSETLERPGPLRGGIVADDMGLGKTLMLIALIATNTPGAQLPPLLLPGVPGALGRDGRGSSAAAAAAASEAEQPPRKKQKKARGKAAAAAAAAASPAAAAPLSAAQQKAARAKAAAIAAAEPAPSPPAAGGPRGTLIVCPLSVLSNWQTQIEEHTAGNLKVLLHHGADRDRRKAHLAEQDVVITTYATLAAEANMRGSAGLFALEWLRVVLDEAHQIRNADTQQAKACCGLKARARWCVTGTPLQNRLGDVYSLCKFLGLQPLDAKDYWRRCVERPLRQRSNLGLKTLKVLMGSIALRRTKATKGPDGLPLIALPPKQVQLVHLPLGEADAANYAALEAEMKSLVAHHVSARTLAANYTSLLTLIMRLRQVCDSSYLCPGALELLRAATAAAKAAASSGEPPPPELLAKLVATLAQGEEECPICICPLESPVITRCAHCFCRGCIERVILQDKPNCPLCRQAISAASLIEPPPPEAPEGRGASAGGAASQGGSQRGSQAAAPSVETDEAAAIAGSSKIQALLARLREAEAETQQAAAEAASVRLPPPPPLKTVVFSQFLGMLDLVGAALVAERIAFVRVDGQTAARDRKAAIAAFAGAEPESPRVFLASLKVFRAWRFEDMYCRLCCALYCMCRPVCGLHAGLRAGLLHAGGARWPAACWGCALACCMRGLRAGLLQAAGASFAACQRHRPRLPGRRARTRSLRNRSLSAACPAAQAAGVGTNLTAANRCVLLDPWWNGSVEDQAMDRVHRLGQTRPVSIWRFVTRGTIEQRMLELQDAKAQLAKAAWHAPEESLHTPGAAAAAAAGAAAAAAGDAGAGSSAAAAAAAASAGSQAAGRGGRRGRGGGTRGSGNQLGLRADDLRRLMGV